MNLDLALSFRRPLRRPISAHLGSSGDGWLSYDLVKDSVANVTFFGGYQVLASNYVPTNQAYIANMQSVNQYPQQLLVNPQTYQQLQGMQNQYNTAQQGLSTAISNMANTLSSSLYVSNINNQAGTITMSGLQSGAAMAQAQGLNSWMPNSISLMVTSEDCSAEDWQVEAIEENELFKLLYAREVKHAS